MLAGHVEMAQRQGVFDIEFAQVVEMQGLGHAGLVGVPE